MEKDYVKLSKKQWHYKLQKFIFLNLEPSRFQNLCPYFWLTIFCIIVSPIVFIFRIPKNIYLYGLNKSINNIDNIDRFIDVYDKGRIGVFRLTYLRYEIIKGNLVNRLGGVDKFYEILKDKTDKKNIKEKEKYDEYLKNKHNKEFSKMNRIMKLEDAIYKIVLPFNHIFNFLSLCFNKMIEKLPKIKVNFIIKYTKKLIGLLITVISIVILFFVVGYTCRFVYWVGYIMSFNGKHYSKRFQS